MTHFLQMPSSHAPLPERWSWLLEKITWIRQADLDTPIDSHSEWSSKPSQLRRLQEVLRFLDRHPPKKRETAKLLRSILNETSYLETFVQNGMFNDEHFSGELMSRLGRKILSPFSKDKDLRFWLERLMRTPEDIEWLAFLDQGTFEHLRELVQFEAPDTEIQKNPLRTQAEKAFLFLAFQIQALSLTNELRQQFAAEDFQTLPFCRLAKQVESFVSTRETASKIEARWKIEKEIESCEQLLFDLENHLNQSGMSVSIVYKMVKLEKLVQRLKDLLLLLQTEEPLNVRSFMHFIESLVLGQWERKSISSLFERTLSILSKRLVERNGETGEVYITRNFREHLGMLKKAIGGGVLTAGTVLVKTLLHGLTLSPFGASFSLAMNYSISFLGIHFAHFTLGTKQPSVTASALSGRSENDVESFAEEAIHLMRSQMTAIAGNVIGVVPGMIALCGIYQFWTHTPLLNEEEALKTLHDFSLFGSTPLFAYFTGILLWISSLIAGWADNWFCYHRVSAAIENNHSLNQMFGLNGAKRISNFFRKHTFGMAASISLGMLLTYAPLILQFFGFHMEVRHVTLSSGALTAAMMSLPLEALQGREFGLAVLGVMSMGFLNVVVCFGVAMLASIKARRVRAPKRMKIYLAILARLMQKPYLLIWPASPPSLQEESSN